jgi:hypothetical protein
MADEVSGRRGEVQTNDPYDLFDLEFRLSPDVLHREMARAGCLVALNRMIHLQTAERWRTFDDPMAELDLEVSPPACFDLNDPQLEVALKELTTRQTLDADDVDLIGAIHRQSRDVFERLPDLLLEGKTVGTELLEPGHALLRKLEIFWARISLDCNPEFDGVEVSDDDIGEVFSGIARMMVDAAMTT